MSTNVIQKLQRATAYKYSGRGISCKRVRTPFRDSIRKNRHACMSGYKIYADRGIT